MARVWTEQQVEILVLEARAKEKEETIRFLNTVHLNLFGMATRLINLLEAGKVDETLTILKEMRSTAEGVINK